jgi:hypothetical protein
VQVLLLALRLVLARLHLSQLPLELLLPPLALQAPQELELRELLVLLVQLVLLVLLVQPVQQVQLVQLVQLVLLVPLVQLVLLVLLERKQVASVDSSAREPRAVSRPDGLSARSCKRTPK